MPALTSLFLLFTVAATISSTRTLSITALDASLTVGPPYGYDGETSLSITVNSTLSTKVSCYTTCSVAWPANVAPGPINWTACEDQSLQWRLPANGFLAATNFVVELFQATSDQNGVAGVAGSHRIRFNPGNRSDPDAYMSCIQYGKFTPLSCNLGGALSVQPPPVEIAAVDVSARPT